MTSAANAHRILAANLITPTNATMSDVATGRVSQGTKDVSVGGAAGRAGGVYTGSLELQGIVEIDDVTAGGSIGQATYRVSYDNGATWFAGGQATAASVTLPGGNGLTFLWAAGVGTDFAVGDRWKFKVVLPHGVEAGLDFQDLNRTLRFADAVGTKTIVVDHGSAVPVDSFFFFAHDLTSAASIHVQRNATNTWGAPSVDATIPWAADTLGGFFAGGSYRYTRLTFADASNPAALEGKPYLGAYAQLSGHGRSHLPWGQRAEWYGAKSAGPYGYRRASVESRLDTFPLVYNALSAADYTLLRGVRDACWDVVTGVYTPIVFVPDALVAAEAYVCTVDEFELQGIGGGLYAGRVTLQQLARLRAA